jgi:hypothetical protein
VIGRDGSSPTSTALYADDRGVSRVDEMSLTDDRWRIWRDDPELSQRFEALVSTDRTMVLGHWEKPIAGGECEHDFNVDNARCERA